MLESGKQNKYFYSQIEVKHDFVSRLVEHNIFEVMTDSLRVLLKMTFDEESEKNNLTIKLIGILSFIVQTNYQKFVEYLNSPISDNFIEIIVVYLLESEQCVQIQMGDLIKFFLDMFNQRQTKISPRIFSHLLPKIIQQLKDFKKDYQNSIYVEQVLEILNQGIKLHSREFQRFFIEADVLSDLPTFLQVNEKGIVISTIKLLRTMMISKDYTWAALIREMHLMDPIFDIYLKNMKKDNMLFSICQEFFDILRKEGAEDHLDYFIERFSTQISEKRLNLKFEKVLKAYEMKHQKESQQTFPLENINK